MKNPLPTLFLLAFLVWPAAVCRAMSGPDLDKAVSDATTILIGRLDQYIAEPESLDRLVEHNFRANPGEINGGNPESFYLGTVQYRGTYAFHIVTTLKGQPPEPLIVRLPRFSGLGFRREIFQPGKPDLPLKANYLLLLSGDPEHGFVPTTLAPLPASAKASLLKDPLDALKTADQLAALRAYFIASLEDPAGRATAAYMLSGSQDPRVLQAIRPYVDDQDPQVRASVLECMAGNQDLSAIAKIAATGEETQALRQYKSPDAIPLLNRLLADSASAQVRNAAVLALTQMPPSKSSIPFLVKALRDKDMFVVRNSYGLLQRLTPELKLQPYRNQPEEAEIQRAERWWTDAQTRGIY